MAKKTKSYLRGFLIPFSFTPDDIVEGTVSDTTFTTYSAFANTPTPDRSTGLFLAATGGTSIDTDLQVLTSRSGSAASSEYRIKDNADSTTVQYGNNQDSLIMSWNNLKPRTTSFEYFSHDAISDGDGGFIVAYERIQGTTRTIQGSSVDAQNNVTSNQIVSTAAIGSGATFGSNGKPCLVRLLDGSFLCIVSIVVEDKVNINVYRSTDGETFSLASKRALDETIDVSTGNYTIQRMSASSIHGQILLIFSAYSASGSHSKKNHLIQYASIDGGGTFKKVTTSDEIDTFSFKSIHTYKTHNQLAICYIGATDEVHNMLLPHAFFSAHSLRTGGKYIKVYEGSANDFAAGSDANMTSGWCTAHYNPDGSTYLYVKDVSDNVLLSAYSSDSRNWSKLVTNAAPNDSASVFFADSTECLDQFSSVPYNGGAALLHNWTTNNNGESVGIAYLGGFTSISVPFRTITGLNISANSPLSRAGTTFTWLPIVQPSSSSVLAASGTGTDVLESHYAKFNVTTSQTNRIMTRTNSSVGNQEGIIVTGEVFVEEDDSGNVPAICDVEVELSTGNHWKIKIQIYDGRFEVFDKGVGSTSILNQVIDTSQRLDFIVSIWSGKASFYWRYGGYNALSRFNEGFKNYTLTNTAAGSTSQTIVRFGAEGSASSLTTETRWYRLCVMDSYGAADLSNIATSDLVGRKFSTVSPQYIAHGVGIFAQNGPSYIGDEWNIKATSNNSMDNMFYDVSPSPRVQWHSQAVSSGSTLTTQRFVLKISTNTTDLGNDLIALHLANINFKDAALKYWNGSAWVTLFSFETSEGMNHKYIRQGRSIKQTTPTSLDKTYYFHNELKGYIAMCVSGENTEFFRVVSNTEGAFGNASGKLCSVLLDNEPSFDGEVYFIPTNVTIVMNLNGIDSSKWSLEISGQKTIDNQYRIGGYFLGPLAITGTQYSKGRTITLEGGNITTVTQDRTRFSKAFAPEQRTVRISWSDGVDISSFYNTNPDPDYYKASNSSGAEPVSVYQDVPYMMEGILRGLQGSQSPLVYLPSITTTDDTRVYNRRAEHLLGVIDGDINIESVTGDELIGNGTGEVMRVGTINIVEIV